jgi:hypothetical protein
MKWALNRNRTNVAEHMPMSIANRNTNCAPLARLARKLE